jgi:hypothetical protein
MYPHSMTEPGWDEQPDRDDTDDRNDERKIKEYELNINKNGNENPLETTGESGLHRSLLT